MQPDSWEECEAFSVAGAGSRGEGVTVVQLRCNETIG